MRLTTVLRGDPIMDDPDCHNLRIECVDGKVFDITDTGRGIRVRAIEGQLNIRPEVANSIEIGVGR